MRLQDAPKTFPSGPKTPPRGLQAPRRQPTMKENGPRCCQPERLKMFCNTDWVLSMGLSMGFFIGFYKFLDKIPLKTV